MARPKKNPPFITKICEGCKREFVVVFEKNRQRFCTRSCAQNNPLVQEKMKMSQRDTFQKKYGVDHPMKTEQVVENFKKSMFTKYGVAHALKNIDFVKKSKTTKLERYGSEDFNNHEKSKQTCLNRYGVDNPRKSDVVKSKTKISIHKDHVSFLKKYCLSKNISLLFDENSYIGYDFKNKYKFKCDECNREFETDVFKLTHIFCEICNPLDNNTLENELFVYISSIIPKNIPIKRNDRTILFGKELDIYIPFKKLAFELNGLYWHSENGRNIDKFYHLKKTKSCLSHGINLIHIFENEWVNKKDIVKNRIRHLLGVNSDNKIYARNCIVKPLSDSVKKDFLNKNHFQGNDKSSIRYGLFYKEELVSVMTFCKSRFDKKIQYEMYRYCSKLGFSIIGGASKLFSHFKKTINPISVVSYNDRRYFDGSMYANLGFVFVKNTPPNYWYIDPSYKSLINRMTFQKHKLKNILSTFIPENTEWENMKTNGYDRIWDCGNGKWIWTQK